MSRRRESLRNRYLAFVSRHDVAWELAFGALAVLYVGLGFAADDAPPSIKPTLSAAESVITAIFLAEFLSRFLGSYDRRAYIRGHWIDVVALLPFARWLRLLRLLRTFAAVHRAISNIERMAQDRGLGLSITAWLGVMVICSAALFIAERDVNDAMNDRLDAIWWGVVTLTTVGYGDVYPVTAEGRLAANVLMPLGIGLFGAITATGLGRNGRVGVVGEDRPREAVAAIDPAIDEDLEGRRVAGAGAPNERVVCRRRPVRCRRQVRPMSSTVSEIWRYPVKSMGGERINVVA